MLLLISCAASAQALYQFARVDPCVYIDQGRFCTGTVDWVLYNGPTSAQIATGVALTTLKGNAVTLVRNSNKTCFDSNGIALTVTAHQPCVEPAGLLLNNGTTNSLMRSAALATAPWATGNAVVAAPTVTNNSADVTAPDNTVTASKLVFPAVLNAGEASFVGQAATPSALPQSFSVYLATASGTATVYIGATPDNVTYFRQACSVTTTWSRCKLENFTPTAASHTFFIGVDLRDASETGRAAQTVYAWGAQEENNRKFAEPYIPTAGSSATTAKDKTTFTNPLYQTAVSAIATAFTYTPYFSTSWAQGGNIFLNLGDGTANNLWAETSDTSGKFLVDNYDSTGATHNAVTLASGVSVALHRYAAAGSAFGTAYDLYIDGTKQTVSVSGSGTRTAWQPTAYLGTNQPNNTLGDGWYSNICVGTNRTLCMP